MIPPGPPNWGPPGGPPRGKKNQIFVPTGRVIKYPKKCALFCPPGGPAPRGPGGPPGGTPPGDPLSNINIIYIWPQPGGPGGVPGGPPGGPRGAPGGPRAGGAPGGPRGGNFPPPGRGPPGGPGGGSRRGPRRGTQPGPQTGQCYGACPRSVRSRRSLNASGIAVSKSPSWGMPLMAALRLALATGLATPASGPALDAMRSMVCLRRWRGGRTLRLNDLPISTAQSESPSCS